MIGIICRIGVLIVNGIGSKEGDDYMSSMNAFEFHDLLIKLIGQNDSESLMVLYNYMRFNDIMVEFRMAVDIKEE